VRYVSRESNLRRFVYTARVCKRTGRLLGIMAGCRSWDPRGPDDGGGEPVDDGEEISDKVVDLRAYLRAA